MTVESTYTPLKLHSKVQGDLVLLTLRTNVHSSEYLVYVMCIGLWYEVRIKDTQQKGCLSYFLSCIHVTLPHLCSWRLT